MQIQILGAALTAALIAVPRLVDPTLAVQVAEVRDGTVRLSYTAREGVCGNGENISTSRGRRNEWQSDCQDGPVRLVLERRGGKTTHIRAYVGGQWRGSATRDLGQVPAAEAGKYLLWLAEQDEPAADDAIFPATIADSTEAWPTLLRIAKSSQATTKARKAAIFWVGQAAADEATKGLDDLANDNDQNREVRESALFALSQQPASKGIPALIRVAKTSKDPKLRRTALFWLGQSEDPAAIRLFEEILTN
ncbi:MAG: HEAT repeat domain-containing protein [Gemmatimonadetes bacterium]|nr:HEAT repeat domain-containing protein [Gemmatimonadota bacterium]